LAIPQPAGIADSDAVMIFLQCWRAAALACCRNDNVGVAMVEAMISTQMIRRA
jgi:hypothetical protein